MVRAWRDPENLSSLPMGGSDGPPVRALSVSERGLTQMKKTDKACCLMEWNDDRQSSFLEIREILLRADI